MWVDEFLHHARRGPMRRAILAIIGDAGAPPAGPAYVAALEAGRGGPSTRAFGS